jgi:hypothetical protein
MPKNLNQILILAVREFQSLIRLGISAKHGFMSLQVAQFFVDFILQTANRELLARKWSNPNHCQTRDYKNKDNKFSIFMSSADFLFECIIPRQQVAHIYVEFLF